MESVECETLRSKQSKADLYSSVTGHQTDHTHFPTQMESSFPVGKIGSLICATHLMNGIKSLAMVSEIVPDMTKHLIAVAKCLPESIVVPTVSLHVGE